MEQRLKGRSFVAVFFVVWIIILCVAFKLSFREFGRTISYVPEEKSNEADNNTKDNGIHSLDDISPDVLDMMKKYTTEDYEAKIASQSAVSRYLFKEKYGIDGWYLHSAEPNGQ